MRRRRDALFGIVDNWVILIGLIVRGSTRWHRHDLNQVGQVLGFGFLVGFIESEKALTSFLLDPFFQFWIEDKGMLFEEE